MYSKRDAVPTRKNPLIPVRSLLALYFKLAKHKKGNGTDGMKLNDGGRGVFLSRETICTAIRYADTSHNSRVPRQPRGRRDNFIAPRDILFSLSRKSQPKNS